MKKVTLVILLIGILAVSCFAQESQAAKSELPENVKIGLDALLKTRTSNQEFNIKNINSYFYVTQGFVYTNILFSADLDNDAKELKDQIQSNFDKKKAEYDTFVETKQREIVELNKKIEKKNQSIQKSKRIPLKTWTATPAPQLMFPPAYHHLYLRVVKDGNIEQNFKAPMPLKGDKAEYYSFGLILKPGKYDILINITRFNNTQDGTYLFEVEVPKMTLQDIIVPQKKIGNSTPVFYSKVNTLRTVDNRFTVSKNKYQIAPSKLELFPIISEGNELKVGDSPNLSFFLIGATMGQSNPPWNVTASLKIKQGKKTITKFNDIAMNNPYFFQLIEMTKTVKNKKEKLTPGEYMLEIQLKDNNSKGAKGVIEVPFKITE
jgi:hypothetical protein